jgi:NTP pyrophosphatase (non-canonical NTP hydrolase)
MEIKDLAKRASEIKGLYSKMEMQKFGKTWTDAQVMQGFVGDVGELMTLVMAKEGIREIEDVDKKIAHELSDCLYCIFILAERFEVDIEKEFLGTMAGLEKKLAEDKE